MRCDFLSERGTASVEYTVLIVLVGLVGAGAVVLAGQRLALAFLEAEIWLRLAVP